MDKRKVVCGGHVGYMLRCVLQYSKQHILALEDVKLQSLENDGSE